MCGVVGVLSDQPVNQVLYDALIALQHRGQDAAGIVTAEGSSVNLRKDNGLVSSVFETRHMHRLRGNMGIGHVRYPTSGTASSAEAQPMYVNSPYGIALAHNGNLINASQIRTDLEQTGRRHVNTRSDSELLLNVLADELNVVSYELDISRTAGRDAEAIFRGVQRVHERCRGAYAAVAMIVNGGLVGFRDPCGIRPLVLGRREDPSGTSYMFASESAALSVLGFTLVGDVEPGEAVFIDTDGRLDRRQCFDQVVKSPCIFEHVYLAREDSIMDGISVHKARIRTGEELARTILRNHPEIVPRVDIVAPIPETSRTAAVAVAAVLQKDYRETFVKNRYIGRTFIMPGQAIRRRSVQQKLNVIRAEVEDKSVLLVEDSIVRGTTTREIVQQVRAEGAREVYLAVASPPVRFPNVYGIDMPSEKEFVAYGHDNVADISRYIGTDNLVYLDLDDLKRAVYGANVQVEGRIDRFDCSVFDGEYVTGELDSTYLTELSSERSDEAKNLLDLEMPGGETIPELNNEQ